MQTDLLFYLVALPLLFTHGVSKAGFGGMFAVVTVPVLSLIVAVPEAAAITLPIYCTLDLIGLWTYRRNWDARALAILLPAGLIGFAAGIVLVLAVQEAALRVAIGSFTLLHVVSTLARRAPRPAATEPPARDAALWGALAGVASFVAHAGSTVVSMHLLKRHLPPTRLVGTSIAFTAVLNHLKIPAFASLGQLGLGTVATAAVLLPAAALGMHLGVRLARHIPRPAFERICQILLAGAGIALVLRGLVA